MIYPIFGKYLQAIEETKKAIALNPEFSLFYTDLAGHLLVLTIWRRRRIFFSVPPSANLESSENAVLRYSIAFLKSDRRDAKRNNSWPVKVVNG